MWCSSFFLYLHSSSSLAQPWFLCLSGFVVLAEDKTLLINVAVKRACFLVLNWTSSSKDTFWNLGYTGYTWIYTSSCTMLCSSRCIRSKAQHVPLLPLPFTQNLRNANDSEFRGAKECQCREIWNGIFCVEAQLGILNCSAAIFSSSLRRLSCVNSELMPQEKGSGLRSEGLLPAVTGPRSKCDF